MSGKNILLPYVRERNQGSSPTVSIYYLCDKREVSNT